MILLRFYSFLQDIYSDATFIAIIAISLFIILHTSLGGLLSSPKLKR